MALTKHTRIPQVVTWVKRFSSLAAYQTMPLHAIDAEIYNSKPLACIYICAVISFYCFSEIACKRQQSWPDISNVITALQTNRCCPPRWHNIGLCDLDHLSRFSPNTHGNVDANIETGDFSNPSSHIPCQGVWLGAAWWTRSSAKKVRHKKRGAVVVLMSDVKSEV